MSSNLKHTHQSLNVGSLAAYIQWANQIPLLSIKEEKELACQLKEHNNLAAARQLVLAHLRLVIKIARGYSGYGLAQSDLIQEGNIGLMKAVKRFNPDLGIRLVSFAIHWIRAEIHEFIIRNWRIVKIATTKAQRKLFFNLKKMSKKRGWFSNEETKIVAETLNVNQKEVLQMEARLNHFDEPFHGYDDTSSNEQPTYLSSPDKYLEAPHVQNPEQVIEQKDWSRHQKKRLFKALKNLDKRSQDIVHARWLNTSKSTLHELAQKYNISAERVRQLEKNAMSKLYSDIKPECSL